jgi:hypothetical protein
VKEEGAGGLLGLTGLESSIYPGSGPFVEGETPTPACLVLISASYKELQRLQLRFDLARVCLGFRKYRLQLPPVPYIDGRVPGVRT